MDSLFFGRFSTRHLFIAAGTMAMILLVALVFHRSWLPIEITLPETGVLVAREQPFLKPDSAVPEVENVKLAALEEPNPIQTDNVEVPHPPPLRKTVSIEQRKPTPPRSNKPTVVYKLPKPFEVPVSDAAQRWNFVIPTGVKSELFFRGAEFRPALAGRVKRMILAYDTTGRAKKEDQETLTPGFSSPIDGQINARWILAEWQPGEPAAILSNGPADRIPAGADLVLTVDYQPISKPIQDPWAIAFYLSRSQILGVKLAR